MHDDTPLLRGMLIRKRKGLMIYRVIFAFSLLLVAITKSHGQDASVIAHEAYAVRWTAAIELDDISSIDAELDRPLVLSGNKKDVMELACRDRRGHFSIQRFSSRRGYLKARLEGGMPRTGYDVAMDSWAALETFPLALLRQAKPSVSSHVSALSLDGFDLRHLPYAIMTFSERMPDGYSFHDDCPEPVMEIREPHQLRWYCPPKDPHDQLNYQVMLLAWGDFNHDGLEDVLMKFNYWFSFARNSGHEMVVLTRYPDQESFTLVGFAEDVLRKGQPQFTRRLSKVNK